MMTKAPVVSAPTTLTSQAAASTPKVIIIGAGWSGIAAARTYMQVNPSVDLTIIDEDSTAGGTWSAARIYPGLCADSPSGAFEFSDLTMSEELGIKPWTDLTGDQVHEYLERYVRKYGILERCRLQTRVINAKKTASGWDVTVKPAGSPFSDVEILHCDKLIIATGLTSKPVMPKIDTTAFVGQVFHSKEFGQRHKWLTSDAVQNVTVVGGNKSSFEVVRLCALAGKRVTWLIRPDGQGPGIMLYARNGDRHISQLGYARWTSVLKTGLYMPKNWWYHFLQSGYSTIGLWLNKLFWRKQMQANTEGRYTKSENGRKLRPFSDSLFWVPGISVVHDSDMEFLKLVDEETLVHVHHASISSVNKSTIQLSNGETITSDVIVFCTGWDPGCNEIFDPADAAEYGVSTATTNLSAEYLSYWQNLDKSADKYVMENYPMLRDPPKAMAIKSSRPIPYRCFRTIAPTALARKHDRSLVHLGMLADSQVPTFAAVSALWAVAYLDDLLADGTCDGLLGNKKEMDKDVANMTAFMARRYPGRFCPQATLEIQSYIDKIMQDLGLRVDRKRVGRETEEGWFGIKGWLREWFQPYVAVDYKGIIQEFLDSRAMNEGKKVV